MICFGTGYPTCDHPLLLAPLLQATSVLRVSLACSRLSTGVEGRSSAAALSLMSAIKRNTLSRFVMQHLGFYRGIYANGGIEVFLEV